MKTYKIGDFCKKVGVSSDFLKYQEERGIIQPCLKEDSDYRYYHFAQAGKIYDALRYKNLGFSSREIKQLVSEKSSAELLETLAGKASDLERQLVRRRRQLDYLQSLEQRGRCENRPNPWYVSDFEGYYFLPHSHRNDLFGDERTSALVREWSSWMPNVSSAQKIVSAPHFGELEVDEDADYYWGFLAGEDFVKEVHLSTPDPVLYIPPHRSLVYYQSTKLSALSEQSPCVALRTTDGKPAETMKQCGFKAAGDIYNVTLFYSHEDGHPHIHTQLIIPLAD